MRIDGRKFDQLRPIKITPNVNRYAEGSVLVEFGETKVLCTASFETQVPKWLAGSQKGWVTAEYAMLPRSTHERIKRDKAMTSGRTQEISRLIGRSLRAAVDLYALGEKQVTIDCDVLQADGGTRTASITGGFVALALGCQNLKQKGLLQKLPLKSPIAAISVGMQKNQPLLDLNYIEDSDIQTDMNFVMNTLGQFIEIQGTAEDAPFDETDMSSMMKIAKKGCDEIFEIQKAVLRSFEIEV